MARKNKQQTGESPQAEAPTTAQEKQSPKRSRKPKTWQKERMLKTLDDLNTKYENITESETFTQEAINGDDLLIKALALINDNESRLRLGKEILTEEQKKRIGDSITTYADRKKWMHYIWIYDLTKRYHLSLSYVYSRYKVFAALLANLTDKWELYRQEAQRLTDLYNGLKSGELNGGESLTGEALASVREFILSSHNTPKPTGATFFGGYTNLWRSTLIFNEGTDSYEVDITRSPDGEKSLKETMDFVKGQAVDALTDVKAYMQTLWEWLFAKRNEGGEKYLCLSIPLRNLMHTILSERWVRNITTDATYLESCLNEWKAAGIETTPEDESKAVMPDIYEIEPNTKALVTSKNKLEEILNEERGY